MESLDAWETNAEFWDNQMGDESNSFHREIVLPHTEELLEIKTDDLVLDIACGNGNFSKRLAEQGAKVVGFDYSPKMIEFAKSRRADVLDKVIFKVCDATDYNQLMNLYQKKPFTKAVANMAIMDISDIEPLFKAVFDMLCENGIFVFATHHPCFTYPNEDYFASCVHKGVAIDGQPMLQSYYHRSIQDIFNLAFNCGYILDGFYEVPFQGEETPIIIIVRLKKIVSVDYVNNVKPAE